MQLRVAASSPASLPAPVALGVLVLLVVLLLGDAAPLLSHLPLRAGSRRLWVAGAGEGGGAGARGARAARRRAAASGFAFAGNRRLCFLGGDPAADPCVIDVDEFVAVLGDQLRGGEEEGVFAFFVGVAEEGVFGAFGARGDQVDAAGGGAHVGRGFDSAGVVRFRRVGRLPLIDVVCVVAVGREQAVGGVEEGPLPVGGGGAGQDRVGARGPGEELGDRLHPRRPRRGLPARVAGDAADPLAGAIEVDLGDAAVVVWGELGLCAGEQGPPGGRRPGRGEAGASELARGPPFSSPTRV